jgi:asparagine synthase (glutamine-hydrolysing)
MCGIAGAFAFGLSAKKIDKTVIERLNLQQRRRGPDGTGLWLSTDERIVLGHQRLAIIDPGPGGAQPMRDATGRWIISFNGEIYNYRALREELERLGCVFETNSDTEVLINVVAYWGESGFRKLRGMYAVALWDCVERELWLIRDPYGIKPLYLAESAGTLWFASQARALARCAPINTSREAAALTGFYLWGHIPEPFTWWAGIRMLPAGHVLRVRADAECHTKPFAKIEHTYVDHPARPLQCGELRSLLCDSVTHHLVSDVPVGIFLSAGIDSNAVAALASELSSNLQSVTLAFDEYVGTDGDEAPLAEAAARAFGCKHTSYRIGRSEFEAVVDDFFDCMDQPTIDGLNTYLVSYAAGKLGLKVALSGLGGDELFGGYPSFWDVPQVAQWGRRLSILQPFGDTIRRALRTINLPGMPPKLPALFTHSASLAKAYFLRRALYLEDELDTLLDESWISEGLKRLATQPTLATTCAPLNAAGASEHVQVAALESCWYMRNQLLRDTDWSSMAHGVEVRVPFVDFALIESLGPAIASKSPPTKRDLAACSDRIPAAICKRAKTGFTTPVRKWIAVQERDWERGLRGWATRVHQRLRTDAVTSDFKFPLRDAA